MQSASTAIAFSDFSSILSAIGQQISVSSVVSTLAAIIPLVIGFVFMWWGVRKGTKMLMGSFRKGRVNP